MNVEAGAHPKSRDQIVIRRGTSQYGAGGVSLADAFFVVERDGTELYIDRINEPSNGTGSSSFAAAVVLMAPSLTPAPGDPICLMQYARGKPAVSAVDSGDPYDCPENWWITNEYANTDLWIAAPNQHILVMFPDEPMPTAYARVRNTYFEAVEVLGGQIVSVGCGGAGLFNPSLWIGSNTDGSFGGFIDPLVAATSFIPHSVNSSDVAVGTWGGFNGTLSYAVSGEYVDTAEKAFDVIDDFHLVPPISVPGQELHADGEVLTVTGTGELPAAAFADSGEELLALMQGLYPGYGEPLTSFEGQPGFYASSGTAGFDSTGGPAFACGVLMQGEADNEKTIYAVELEFTTSTTDVMEIFAGLFDSAMEPLAGTHNGSSDFFPGFAIGAVNDDLGLNGKKVTLWLDTPISFDENDSLQLQVLVTGTAGGAFSVSNVKFITDIGVASWEPVDTVPSSFAAAVVLMAPSLTPAPGDKIYLMFYSPGAPAVLAIDSGNAYDCPADWGMTNEYVNSDLWIADPNQHVLIMFPEQAMPTAYGLVRNTDFEQVEVLGGQIVSVGCGGAGFGPPALWVGFNDTAGLGGGLDPLLPATSFIPHSVTDAEVQISQYWDFTGTLSDEQTGISINTAKKAFAAIDAFDLTGTPGPPGASAYEVAVEEGFVGDEAAWLASLDGPQGDPGTPGTPGDPGDSAYQVAVAEGFVGNEAAWLASLVGPQGDPGDPALWNFTGAYSGGAAYAIGDVATYLGQTWYRLNANGGNTGDTPAEGTFWTLIAAEGSDATLGVGLTAIDGLTPATDRLPYFTGATTAALATFTAAGRALLDDALASDQRTTLGLGGAAILNVGTAASTVAAGDDTRLVSFPLLVTGQYTSTSSITTAATSLTTNRLYYLPFLITVSTTFDRIAINHAQTAAGAGSVARLGIYNSTSGLPSTRVLDAGTVDLSTGAALKFVSISQILTPGLYWLSAVPQITSGSPTFTVAPPSIAVPSDTSISTGTKYESSVTGTLPASATPLASNVTQPPVLYLRKSA